jgi:hypothetical protein
MMDASDDPPRDALTENLLWHIQQLPEEDQATVAEMVHVLYLQNVLVTLMWLYGLAGDAPGFWCSLTKAIAGQWNENVTW